ncbi:GntR family transcriptional regulator [Microbacterium sp. NEAU-LLB]|uniref:GntR family transcriptional regulator n=2 Tax=Microbacterium stercoris TaxID=2820289 RepID=A0A939TPA0_9MICO|nr:GntR family transcriptional regulator [Microbacterium stercoris]
MSIAFTTPLSNRGPRLSDLAFERIAEAIVAGALEPGAVLRDADLAAQLGVSRMPVREALQRLERTGLVETAASRYTRVTVFTEKRIADGIEFGGMLYGGAMQMALRRMDLATHQRLIELLDELCEASEPEAVIDSCQAALAFALENSGNEVMERRRDVQYLLARLRNVAAIAEFVDPIRAHRDMLRAAVVVRDADTAELTVRRMYRIC